MLIEFEKYGHGKGLAVRVFANSLRDPPIAERLYEPPPAWFQPDYTYDVLFLQDPDGPQES